MAELKELEDAFVKADAAGNTEDAAAFATEIKKLRPPERRQLASSQLDKDRELLRSDAGRQVLTERANKGDVRARGSIGALADIALEGGGATAGQLIGAIPALSVPTGGASIPVGGALGGMTGNYAAQRRRMAAGEQEGFRVGELLSTGLVSAIPGSGAATATGKVLAKEAGKQALAGLGSKTIETVLDEGRLPTATEAAFSTAIPAAGGALAQKIRTKGKDKLGSTARETLEEAKKLGVKVVPSDVSDSFLNKRLESLAGPADVRRAVSIENQKAANRVAATELGLPKNTEVTRAVLKDVREKAAKPYQEIDAIAENARSELATIKNARDTAIQNAKSTAADAHDLAVKISEIEKRMADPATAKHIGSLEAQASANLQELREARDLMNANRPPYPQADAGRMALYRETKDKVDALENNLEAAALAAGRPELVDELKNSRKLIAKSHDIEKTNNIGDANVSLPILGALVDKKDSISGGLRTMGKFAEAFPRNVSEGAKTIPFNLSKTEALVGGLLAASGYGGTGNPKALLLAAVPPIVSNASRALATSRLYQGLLTSAPFAMPNAALATRVLAQEAGQEVTRDPKRTNQ